MGTMNFFPNRFSASISEVVGYKSGLALSFEEMTDLIARQDGKLLDEWPTTSEESVRIRAEVFEAFLASLLFSVGATSSPGILSPGLASWHRYKNDGRLTIIERDVMEMFLAASRKSTEDRLRDNSSQPFDVTPFVEDAARKHGAIGLKMAMELIEEFQNALMRSPRGHFRQVEWKDQLELKSLFESESLDATHGRFIDQRFIEYLGQQFGDVDRMNWRKFEGLTGEYFERLGLKVVMGPGRNDGGIDIRVWGSEDVQTSPPLLLIQCKREKTKVSKTVVKALWADMAHEGAKSGLIVTSTSFSPGAKQVCLARSYRVSEANRETLKKWLASMREPNTGVFLGE